MNNRPSLGFDDDIDETVTAEPAAVLDLSDFKPTPAKRPDKAAVAKAAEKTQFKSREPKAVAAQPAPVPSPAPVAARATRRRRTGRSAQLNLKVRPDTIEAFYAIADANGWVLGEAFEKAVELLHQASKK
ncbi:stability/partitioning determinant [Rhizobium paknamense]|uniref:Cell division septation protein DedD n=1 Tax=Rhizobium paknamense TaxID=1206817 RepID=A0ABU0IKW7_9HYPH|nr:stability/partitioning determinant [Rhizobium paknamense]MDQ0458287.1 cell division septation protein DedD [Rhizobium paknamense]